MKFLDQAKVYVRSGAGGAGCLSFRREKFVEFGGPNGGDGGRGGHVYVEAVEGLNTLIDYRYQQHIKAGNGQPGMGSNMTGGSGKDRVMRVPVGTQIYDEARDFMIADLTEVGQRVMLARGGEGGLGNAHFKSSTNQAPRRTTPGGEAEEMTIWLRLKLLADAGLMGLPNAGKSTFLRQVSRARPKVADYPFTTLAPQLGVVGYHEREFVLADIPGLIEGAHEGHGLGDRFLGHLERCTVLLHLIDGTGEDIVDAYKTIRKEIDAYGGGLAEKPEVIGLNKADAIPEDLIPDLVAELEAASKAEVMVLSGHTGTGVGPVLKRLLDHIDAARAAEKAEAEATIAGEEGEAATDAHKGSSWTPL